VFRLLAPVCVVVAAFAPRLALAQVNIDQDKTPAHIFSSDCSVCHKSTRGLANGKSRPALSDFLAEHYTSSRQEAAAMAAYVLAGGGGVGAPAPAREQKPEPDQTRPAAGEPKTREAGHPPAKPQEDPAAEAKPTGTTDEHGKPARPDRSASAEPSAATPGAKPPDAKPPEAKPPEAKLPDGKPSPTAKLPRGKQKPTTVAAVPKPANPPGLAPQASAMPSASGEIIPLAANPAEASPAPTDDIPD
jgi:hypothetical protein